MDEHIINTMGKTLEEFVADFDDKEAPATISYYSTFLQDTERYATAIFENCILNRSFDISTDEQNLLEARQYAQAMLNSLYEH